MKADFHIRNRGDFASNMKNGDVAVFFSGKAPHKTADEYYPFFAHRNFLYLTGIEQADSILLLRKNGEGFEETLFILPNDKMKERWTGKRLTPEEAAASSGISRIRPREEFEGAIDAALGSHAGALWLDFDRYSRGDAPTLAYDLSAYAKERFPYWAFESASAPLKRQRLIKADCEIEAMRHAEDITRDGIIAMMKAAKPGMYCYELKAEFDHALARRGVLHPAFNSIITAGAENFYIHNDRYGSLLVDGEMVLNDVGAGWDNVGTDVSRGWPCNGKYSDRQRLLYECAFATSEHMFGILKPGMTQASVDDEIRRYNFERLRDAGVCKSYEDIGTYMWHGGAHHVGFDTHDVVDRSLPLAPGMVFCVDVGIYHEEWGIGFRLEDNCLMTENGCENLSVATPRTIEEIENTMLKR